ncbi:MAG: glycogen/starch/alpha-glucan phosphorylase [Planctomycetes bacterium]|nr:glycogen/starch/alpha-glucan phosphorylase [Planctomycetota bacterium]
MTPKANDDRPNPAPTAAPPGARTPSFSREDLANLQDSVRHYVKYILAKQWKYATPRDLLTAVSLAVRERVIDTLLETERRYRDARAKRMYYISMEFLMGRSVGNNLINLGIYDLVETALRDLGMEIEEVAETEPDAALGNGGLGRLAACFLDSLATMSMPGYGYGINYEFGLFRQSIKDGYQTELPDAWSNDHNPWLIERPESKYLVPIYGRVKEHTNGDNINNTWIDQRYVVGVGHDMPVIGFGGKTVNTLRLFSARSSGDFDVEIFNSGDYLRAVEDKIHSERISKVLYPSDAVTAGRELRLLQEYFLVYCSIRDILRRFSALYEFNWELIPEKAAVQLNDTHPALAVAEWMRTLVDEKGLSWERAWNITKKTLAYTNHTLRPEALERWSLPLVEKVLPRHLKIIYEINQRFLAEVSRTFPDDHERARRMSIIEESDPKNVRMAHLAVVGSHAVNGVAALHSRLLKTTILRDFNELWPDAFQNKTNGVTQRRWLLQANPELSKLLKSAIGDSWITNFDDLKRLEPFADDDAFLDELARVKQRNKYRLSRIITDLTGVEVDPHSLFDIQAKRIHLYKRQLLHVLLIIDEYLRIVEDGETPGVSRTHVFAGKAAPGYVAAKRVIKLIHGVAGIINNDARAKPWLRVVFLPDYRVSLAERVIPAADLSEQISTAGMEASGTGNMKFAMNGALTMGTLDGANIEIRDNVGEENVFIFGMKVDEVSKLSEPGAYKPMDYYQNNSRIRRVIDAIAGDRFCPDDLGLYRPIYDILMDPNDEYLHLADLESYMGRQQDATALYNNSREWSRRCALNIARVGVFSSDRTIREYARDIWGLKPVK